MKLRRLALAGLATVAIAAGGLTTAVVLSGGSSAAADPLVDCGESRSEALISNRITASNGSYRKDSPTEYAKVRAYLDGGARPTGVTTHMGLHLVYGEDVCRSLTTTTTTTTTTQPTTTTTTTQPTTTTTTTTTTPPPTANLYISPTGSDTAACTQAAPCKTWNRAYQMASCGQTVSIAAGTYANQTLIERSSCASSLITLAGSGVAYAEQINFGTCQGCLSTNGASDLILRNLKTAGITIFSDSNNVTLDQIDGGAFMLQGLNLNPGQGPSNVTITNSDWGPCPAPSEPLAANGDKRCLTLWGTYQPRIANAANVVIENSTFHDMWRNNASSDHWECVLLWGVNNLTFRGNRFYHCNTNDIAMIGSGLNARGTWLIENNWFGESAAGSALKFGELPPAGNIIVRFNSFQSREAIVDEGGPTSTGAGKLYIVGNILGYAPYYGGLACIGSARGAVYSYNVWIGSAFCPGTGNSAYAGNPYVDGSSQASGNYHLGGASPADNYVPLSAANSGLNVDKDSQARPIGAARDAGSDER